MYGNACGTYLHGILDTPEVLEPLVGALMERKGLDPCAIKAFDPAAYKEEQYDRLADLVRGALDMPALYRILEENHA